MKYQHYHFKDFMLDESFQQWVLEPESQPDSFWFTWVSRHPEKENEIRQARQAILELYQTGARKEVALLASARRPEMATASQDKAATWSRISQAIDAGEAAPSPAPEARVFPMLPPVWLKMAAAVLLLLGLALVFWLRPNRGAPALVAYETAFGQTRRVTLPDRSVIILNANSRLTFARTWAAGQDREVTLAGEAFFAVRPGTQPQKFKVHLREGAQVEVLGTTFTVTDRPSLTRVVLNQGKVRVDLLGQQPGKGTQASARMTPGDLVEINRRENRLTKSRVSRPENYSAFVQHKIEFNNTPLSEVARVLQDNYGYKITFVPASLADKRFTSSNPDNRVDLLLFALEKSFHLQVSRKGKRITLKEL